MTIREITDKILEYHPKFDASYDGCDGFKSGNPDDECTGIVSALVPTVEVIKKAAALGCNLLYVHEPSYYSTPDYPDWRAGFEISMELRSGEIMTIHMHTIQMVFSLE